MINWLKIIFLLFSYFLTLHVFSQDYVLNYQHIQTKNGLANAFVNCALQDNDGFMWFGTKDGLCRYDGKNFLTFRNSEEDSIFLASNSIQAICQLDEHYLLIGTTAGLSKLDLYTQKISRIDFFRQKNILSMLIDSQKTIWVIADKQLFFKKDKQKNWQDYAKYCLKENPNFDKKSITGIYERSINQNNYLVIIEDLGTSSTTIAQFSYKKQTNQKWKKILVSQLASAYFDKNNMWFCPTKKTINEDDFLHQIYDTTIFKIHVLENSFSISNKLGLPFSSIIQSNDDLYSYNSEGVLIIDSQKKQISKFIDWHTTTLDTKKYGIIGIYKDKTNNLWVYTYGAGILVVPIHTLFSIKEYKFQENNPSKSLSGASVRTIYEDDSTKNLWVVTYNEEGKIDIYSPQKQKKSISCPSASYLFREQIDNKNKLWLGSHDNLYQVNKQNNGLKKEPFIDKHINTILALNDSMLWLAKEYQLQKYNPINQKSTIYSEYGKVNCLYLDKNNKIWVGSLTNGIALLDNKQKKPVFYNPQKNSKNTNCQVMAIYQDSKNLFWIATTNGIYSFDEKTKKFKNYNDKNGLPNNTVYATLEDEEYNLWLSTNNGISKFDIEKETFENYDESDGLQNNEFNQKAYLKNADGELFFGGINGLNVFFPKDMKQNNFVPPLYLTKITKQDSLIQFDKPLHQIKELELPIEDAQILSFSFVALNYYRPEKNQYAYKIDELQNDWINLGNEGKLTLTGLAHGNYTLRIKAANNHGVWNEDGITLKLILVPPFYLQNWFLLSSVILFLVLVFLVYKWRLYQIRQNQKLLELQIQKATQALANKNILFEEQNKALEKSNSTQNQLFAIIAHDLRSPLIAFQDISKQIDYFLRKDNLEGLKLLGGYIDNSVQNLNTLLNNLLNWALTQQQQIILQPQEVDIEEVIQETKNIYQNLAQSLNIDIEINITTNQSVYVDKDSFQTIIRNLFSNALKFTPKNGKISIQTYKEISKNKLILEIKDTGIGMSEKVIKEIFQLNLVHTKKGLRGEKSTGLGLVLCQEFAQMNKINIEIESKIDEGTTFILGIPMFEGLNNK